MRQIGVLEDEAEAQRFAAYLVTEGIASHAEEDGEGWAIWVRDENQVETAREALADFRRDPQAAQYQGLFVERPREYADR